MRDWLSEAASLYSTKDFVITDNKVYTFNGINIISTRLANLLKNNYEIKRGNIAAVLSENNIDFIILLLALWKTGAVSVPINIRLNDSETNDLITFLKPSFIFTGKEISYKDEKSIPFSFDYTTYEMTEEIGISEKQENSYDENDTALILFTSGTSGNPKGVQLSFHNLRASFDNSDTILKHNSDDKWAASLPFYHIGGFSIITRALLSGTSIMVPKSLNTVDLADAIIKHRPTLLSLVSTQLKRFIDLGIRPWAELKCVLLGGGHIEDSLVDEAIKDGWPISKVYGSTETSSLITIVNCNKNCNKKASGGKPLAKNQIFIINDKKEILPHNTPGEIVVKSESCSNGYYNNSKETDNKFINGIYYTGDSGYIDEDGYLFIDSRNNDLIISGGENINPKEIETALMEYPGIQNVAAFGQEDNEWGQIVSVAIITEQDKHISENELNEFLLRRISRYKVPKKYYFMSEFPMSPLGKIQKEKLKDIINRY